MKLNVAKEVFQVVAALCILNALHYSHTWTILSKSENVSPVRPDIYRFCPTTKGCEDGLHVLCLLNKNIYGSHGPSCNYTAQITLKDTHKYKIVNYINSIRRKVALGREVSEPRGYGIYMVSWDPYLADFAQIWADQCIIRTDRACHATPDFPNPAQLVTSIRYSFPELKKLQRRNLQKTRLSKKKHKVTDPQIRAQRFVDRTIQMVIEAWYSTRSSSARSMYYDQVVHDRVIKIGCGINVFMAFEHQTRKDNEPILNHMMLVCNLSHKLSPNEAPYAKEKNTSLGFTERCGCPPGTDEDQDTCLCYPSARDGNIKDCPFGYCKPKVVVLPIVTVENAAPRVNVQRSMTNDTGDADYFRIINEPSHISLLDKEELQSYQPNNLPQDLKHFDDSQMNRNIFQREYDTISEKLDQHGFLNTYGDQQNITVENPQVFLDLTNYRKDNENEAQRKLQHLPNLEFKDKPISYEGGNPIIRSEDGNKLKLKLNFGGDKNKDFKANSKEPLVRVNVNTPLDNDNDFLKLLNNLESELHHIQLNTNEKELLHSKLTRIYNDIGSKIDSVDKAGDADNDKMYNKMFHKMRPIINPKEQTAHHPFLNAHDEIDNQDVLSITRRKYYQDKLEKLAQKLMKRRRQHNHDSHHLRPTLQDNYARPYPVYQPPAKPIEDMIYRPGRARPVHGYF